MRRGAEPRHHRDDARHELKGGVPEAASGIGARGELDYFQGQQKGSITRAEFTAKAMKLANAKARELGWIT